MIVLAVILILVLILIITNLCVVQQAQAYVIERLGAYSTTWGKGLHVKLPFIERVARRVSLKEQVADFPPQPVITKDNVTMQIDTVVYFQITDPTVKSRDRIVKKSEKGSLYAAMDVASVWLERALAKD